MACGTNGVCLALGCGAVCEPIAQPPQRGDDGVWLCPSDQYTLDGVKVTWLDARAPLLEPAACEPIDPRMGFRDGVCVW